MGLNGIPVREKRAGSISMEMEAAGDPPCRHESNNPKAAGGEVWSRPSITQSFQAEVKTGGAGMGDSGNPGISPQKNASVKKVAVPRLSPPVPCVATRYSCKPSAPACCDPCASCECRFFRTICSCRVFNLYC